VTDDDLVAEIKAAQEHTRRQKRVLENAHEAYQAIPAPDPAILLNERQYALSKAPSALYTLAVVGQTNIAHDIEIFDEAIALFDKALTMVEDGRSSEAQNLLRGLPALMRQLSTAQRK
jgi:tetratricopeptide (TPR) repeat protein